MEVTFGRDDTSTPTTQRERFKTLPFFAPKPTHERTGNLERKHFLLRLH